MTKSTHNTGSGDDKTSLIGNVTIVNTTIGSNSWEDTSVRRKPRSQLELGTTEAIIPRSRRALLQDKDKEKHIANMVKGISSKFTVLDVTKLLAESSFQISHTANLSIQLREIQLHFAEYDLLHIFTKFPDLDFDVSDLADAFHAKKTINLFDSFDSIDLHTACQTVNWMRQYMDDETLRELNWTHKYLINSCEDDSGEGSLFNSVSSKVASMEAENIGQHGGPITFMFIISFIISSSEEALGLLADKLQTLKITDYQGENVITMNSQLKYVINRLSHTNHLPQDIDKKIIKLMQTSSNEDFNTAFRTLGNLVDLGYTKTPVWSESLGKAETLYTKELTKGNWNSDAVNDTNSAFKAGVICFNCGEPDHISPNCPHKSNEHKKTSDDLSLRPSSQQGDVLTLSGDKKCWTRGSKGDQQKWCGKCKLGEKLGRWTTSGRRHFTHEHTGGPPAPHANLCKDTNASEPAAAAADGSATSTVPPTEKKTSFSSTLTSFASIARGAAKE